MHPRMFFWPLIVSLFATPFVTVGQCTDAISAVSQTPKAPDFAKVFRSISEDYRAEAIRLMNELPLDFWTPARRARFQQIWDRHGPQLARELRKSIFYESNQVTRRMLALIIARGNIKDLIWQASEDSRQKMLGFGVDPIALSTLFRAQDAKEMLHRIVDLDLLPPKNLSAQVDLEVQLVTGLALNDLLRDDHRLGLYADELIAIGRGALLNRKTQLERNPSDANGATKIAQIDNLLKGLTRDRWQDLTLRLSRRNLDSFKSGNLSGDCTACGSVNYWTMGSWIGTAESNELIISLDGEFFTRINFMLVESQGKPMLWGHAIEFTPLARPSKQSDIGTHRFQDKRTQRLLLEKSLKAFRDFGRRAGINHIFMTDITNSEGFETAIVALAQAHSKASKTSRDLSLWTPLTSLHRLMADVTGASSMPIRIYLQGWLDPVTRGNAPQFLETAAGPSAPLPKTINFYGRSVSREFLDQVSRAYATHLRSTFGDLQGLLDQLTTAKIAPEAYTLIDGSDNELDLAQTTLSSKLLAMAEILDKPHLDDYQKLINEGRDELAQILSVIRERLIALKDVRAKSPLSAITEKVMDEIEVIVKTAKNEENIEWLIKNNRSLRDKIARETLDLLRTTLPLSRDRELWRFRFLAHLEARRGRLDIPNILPYMTVEKRLREIARTYSQLQGLAPNLLVRIHKALGASRLGIGPWNPRWSYEVSQNPDFDHVMNYEADLLDHYLSLGGIGSGPESSTRSSPTQNTVSGYTIESLLSP